MLLTDEITPEVGCLKIFYDNSSLGLIVEKYGLKSFKMFLLFIFFSCYICCAMVVEHK